MKKPHQLTPSFVCKSYPAKKPRRVIFFFTAFASKAWQYKPAYQALNKLGYDVYSYQFQGRELLKVDADFLIAIGDKIVVDLHHKVKEHKSRGVTEFALFGVSMGSAFGIRCAKHTPEIKRIVLLTVYGNCAQEIWEFHPQKDEKDLYGPRYVHTASVRPLPRNRTHPEPALTS